MPAFALERRGVLSQGQAPPPTRLSSVVLPAQGSSTWQSVNVTVPASCKGVLVLIPQMAVATNQVTGVIVAGLPLTLVGDQAADNSRVYAYFLGSAIPAGTYVLYIQKTGAAQPTQATVHFLGATVSTAIDVVASSVSLNASPSALSPQALTLASDAREIFHAFGTQDPTTAHFTVAGGTTQDSLSSTASGTVGNGRKSAGASGAASVGFNGSTAVGWAQLAASIKNAALVSPPALTYDEMIMRRTGIRAWYNLQDAAKPFVNQIRLDALGDIPGAASGSMNNSGANVTAHVSGPKGSDFAAQFSATFVNRLLGSDGSAIQTGDVFGGEFWFKRDRANGVAGSAPPDGEEWVAHKWDGSATGTGFGWLVMIHWASGHIYLQHVGGSSICHTNATVNDLNWHHFAFGKNGSSNTLILDGVVDSINDTNTEVIPVGSSIGLGGDYSGRPFAGKVSKFAIYSRMPTQAEAAESFAF
jgi:hypothetical protein